MYSAISGLRNHQIMLDVTANDLANVNTVGFKASRTSFRDSLAQLQRSGASATTGNAGAKSAQIGLGVQLGSIDNIMTNGAFQSTAARTTSPSPATAGSACRTRRRPPDRPAPDTFPPAPRPSTPARQLHPQRPGRAHHAGRWRVVGKGVDPTPAAPDAPTRQSSSRSRRRDRRLVSPDGAVTYTPSGGGTRATAGFLSLASFPNEAGLDRVSANRWQATASSGAAADGTPGVNGLGQTVGGELEMSNVDLATEFTNMITAQRGFEASSRVLSTCDEMLQTLVNLKH
jgi:flagellar hook protein FlgE